MKLWGSVLEWEEGNGEERAQVEGWAVDNRDGHVIFWGRGEWMDTNSDIHYFCLLGN